ncbi:unnamed protein product [Chondrus crispus]|uniref:Major facilitator superfamily (MFS) profile domain-containing protein n=1 Tax=Chondrus crispus TaxID=2769 RepID=R7Q7X2_CHOCR|nr:unnamed protein product [Chondrus crispus]CDF34129.1 unnamed protein product [Chondrus crispus]|eukprot:XP_005713948.1 unnamed protein product [Chondrus crispus]
MALDTFPDLPQSATAQKRWSIAFTAALMNAIQSGSFFFTPTTLMPLIVADFGISLSLSTVPIAVGKVAYVLLLIPGGIMVDHYGPRRCVLAGIFGLALIMTMYSLFVASFWSLLVSHILLAAVASVSGVPVYSIFIAQWFEGGIGLAMGLVLAGYSAGGTLVPPLLGPIASACGWRVAMGCMCSLLWFVGLPVSYFFLHEYGTSKQQIDPEDAQPLVDSVSAQSETSRLLPEEGHENVSYGLPDTGMTDQRSWTFVGFAFSYILLQYCFGCFGENVMFFLTIDRGMSLGVASLFFSALNLAAFTAKLVGGHLGDHFDRFHVASASSGIAAVGTMFLFLDTPGLDEDKVPSLTTHPVAMLTFTVLFGFGYGATFNCLYALTPIVFGKQNLGQTQSTLFGLGLAGNAVGSVLTGVLRSKYGSYERPFLIAGVACLANFFVFNVTRMTLGGSLEGFKTLNEEQETPSMTGTYHGIEELEAAEDEIRQRIGGYRSAGTSAKVSPKSSHPQLVKFGDFPSADFAPISSPVHERLRSSQSEHLAIGKDVPVSPLSTSTSFMSHHRHNGTGMQIEHGYPIVRDWSNSSLRSYLGRTTSIDSNLASPKARPLRKSSTMEKIIESGILSASFEAVGYLGSGSSIRHPCRSPPSGSPPSGSPLPSLPRGLPSLPNYGTAYGSPHFRLVSSDAAQSSQGDSTFVGALTPSIASMNTASGSRTNEDQRPKSESTKE